MEQESPVRKKRKPGKRWPAIVTAVTSACVILALMLVLYVDNYYHALPEAEEALKTLPDEVTVEVTGDYVLCEPEGAITGIVFYPGALVEYTAYEPLAAELAKNGLFVAIVKMPYNLAILDIDAAGDVMEEHPEITDWYVAGHSMGGAAAGMYAETNSEKLRGLIFLAAYTTSDLSDTDLSVLSVYGTEDGVLKKNKYTACLDNLPDGGVTEVVIEGGCHAYFGSYGPQAGDGIPTITAGEQLDTTVSAILDFVK